jgi:hypothetical protein
MTENATSHVGRAAIDAYLDSVEQALIEAQAPRSDRVQVWEDLESQITEMLAQQPQPITEEIIRSVIAELEPASHFAAMYGSGKQPQAASPGRIARPRGIRWSYIAAACFTLPLLGVLLEWAFSLGPRHSGAILTFSILAALVATPYALTTACWQLRTHPGRCPDRDLVVKMIMTYAVVAPAFVVAVLTEWTYGLVLIPCGVAGLVYLQYRLVRRLYRYVAEALPPQSEDASSSDANRGSDAKRPISAPVSMPAM